MGFAPRGVTVEVADDLHVGVHSLVLVAVDVLVHGHLDVVAVGGQESLGADRVGQHQIADREPALVVAHLIRGLQGVDDHAVDVATLRRLAEHLIRHARRYPGGFGLGLELGQQR